VGPDKERGARRRGVIQAGERGTTHPFAFINIVTFLGMLTSPSTWKKLVRKWRDSSTG
jgi:hypothetical protein